MKADIAGGIIIAYLIIRAMQVGASLYNRGSWADAIFGLIMIVTSLAIGTIVVIN